MTNEYKIQLLNYIIGKMEPTQPDDSEIFIEQESINRDVWVEFIPDSWQKFRYEGMIAGNEFTSNLSVLYGGYVDNEGNTNGIITLVDENFLPVKTFYNYSSGTPLRYIQYMKQAEDGSFYFIDDSVYSFNDEEEVETSEKRFVMTNNFTIQNNILNDYIVRLRTSYIFSSTYENFYCKNMFKDPNSSHYIFFGVGTDTTYHDTMNRLRIIGLKVNVGSANEWTMYYDDDSNATTYGSAIATFQDNQETSNVRFRCLCQPTYSLNYTIDCVSKEYTGNVSRDSIITFSYKPYIDDDNYKKQSVFTDYDNVYFVQNNQRWGTSVKSRYIGLYKYNFTNSILSTIYEKYLGDYGNINVEAIYIDHCNTDLYIQFNNNIDTTNNTANYYFQRLINDEWNPILIGENLNFIHNQRTMYIKSNFNLLQVYLYATNFRRSTWFLYLIKEDYNTLNYNGTPYIDYNSLISKKSQVYSNNKLIFARNLYNRNLNYNSTISTIQIPTNYLNNINIELNKLISTTDLDINVNQNIFTKNIYEMLYINYINTINVIDQDENIIYNNTGSYITNNINTGTENNYNNSFMNKVRINYENGTQILNIGWDKIDNTHYEITFTLDTRDNPLSIDYISNDETTVYITKQLNLKQNTTYEIKQKIRIE